MTKFHKKFFLCLCYVIFLRFASKLLSSLPATSINPTTLLSRSCLFPEYRQSAEKSRLPGDLFGDGVLDLEPRVNLHEVVVSGRRLDEELDGSGVGVSDALAEVNRIAKDGSTNLDKVDDIKIFGRKT